jgi:hypothetical protein
MTTDTPPIAKLRLPFPAHQISKLPKATRAQTEAVRANFKAGIRCTICGAWHHPDVVHLDYVGHAALTDRLLDTDIEWTWGPLALTDEGLPRFTADGGLWIRLTVCGVTRLGYGSADGKSGGDAVKEIIGDALRNAAMRFGAALDLWHKGDLHVEQVQDDAQAPATQDPVPAAKQAKLVGPIKTRAALRTACGAFVRDLEGCADRDMLDAVLRHHAALIEQVEAESEFYWKGDGADFAGLEKEIEAAAYRVAQPDVPMDRVF